MQTTHVGADPQYRVPLRVITESPFHALVAHTMFIRDGGIEGVKQEPYTRNSRPSVIADPEKDGTQIDAFVIANLAEKKIIIGGTSYEGEIKKSLFAIMNYLMPEQGVLPRHCSANYGKDKTDCAVFFGLSGTGKTTLSAVADRTLIGDDEHGWSENGVFNFEGGCYAKVIRLSEEKEPEICNAIGRSGALLENVVLDEKNIPLYDDETVTENTRAAYAISHIPNMAADAFGVLPPVSKLSPAQAMYHFLAGYTAKVAGTEAGITEPQATFSPCFGAPVMPLPLMRYAELLRGPC